MDGSPSTGGFALLCDDYGMIREVLRNDLGLERLVAGMPLGQQVDPSDWVKLLNFLADLRSKHTVSHWEINFLKGGQIITLHLSGAVVGGLMITGAEQHQQALELLAEMLQTQNKPDASVQAQTDFLMFNEISRLNNELVTLQRDLAKKNVELERLYGEVRLLSITDSLTSIYNRRGFFEKGAQEIERAKRYQHPLAVIMFDIDHFKNINDRYGHAVGDEVLIEIVLRISRQMRKEDILGRHGGDEFFILLPETARSDALLVAERLCRSINEDLLPGATGLTVTISLGVATLSKDTADLDALLLEADQALYQAKRRGGNCACAGPE